MKKRYKELIYKTETNTNFKTDLMFLCFLQQVPIDMGPNNRSYKWHTYSIGGTLFHIIITISEGVINIPSL